jgi:hypothetical protein
MKKLLLVILILLSACQKDNQKKSIIGTWRLVSIISNIEVDLNEDGFSNTDLIKEFPGCYNYTCTFLKNGDYERTVTGADCKTSTVSAKWTLSDETLIINYDDNLYHQHQISINEKLIMYDGIWYEDIKADVIFERI